jgi:hypothetical protein
MIAQRAFRLLRFMQPQRFFGLKHRAHNLCGQYFLFA